MRAARPASSGRSKSESRPAVIWAGAVLALFVAGLGQLPSGAAHGTGHGLDDQLVHNGERLMLGEFDAPQPGPLVIVPYVDGPLTCASDAAFEFLIPLGEGVGVAFLSNATHVLAGFELAGPGFVAFAVDTHDSARTLLIMQEHAVALHWLAARGVPPAAPTAPAEIRTGVLGIPYPIPGAGMGHFSHPLEGGGVAFEYAPEAAGASACGDDETQTRFGILMERTRLPESLAPGRVTHAVALHDPTIEVFLPRPVDSTLVLQANLYLTRPGEDPEAVRDALEARPAMSEGLPLVALALGTLGLVRSRRAG